MKSALTAAFLVVIAGASTGCKTAKSAEHEPGAAAVVAPAEVSTHVVASKLVPKYLLVTGQLKSSRETDLAANATGKVTQTLVERGTQVKAGETLATLDVRAAALSAAEARAHAETAAQNAKTAKSDCERADALVRSGAISRAEFDRLDAQCRTTDFQVSAAQARSKLAAQNVGDGVIRAPFDGFVTERYVDVGEYVSPSSKVVTIVDLASLRLELAVPESNIAAAKKDAVVSFTVAGYPDRTFGGAVQFVGASVRAATRDVVAEATVDNADGVLRPGMFASVRLQNGEGMMPVVPKDAIVTRDDKPIAFVVEGGRLEQRIVQTGDVIGDEIVVLRGIADGERLVLAPADTLKNGQAVK